MARFGFVGGTYQSQSLLADAERCVNWYPELIESQGKSRMALYPTPGLKVFLNLPELTVPGLFAQNGRCFAGGASFYEIFANRTFNFIGMLQASSLPVTMAGSQTQILILAGGSLWLYNLIGGAFAAVPMAQLGGNGNVSQIGFLDGFFLATLKNSQIVQISNLLDGTIWSGLNTGIISVFPDNIVSMLVDHREAWFWGSKNSTVYYDTGAASFPISPIPGVYLETGSAAVYGPCKADNTIFWVAQDERGGLQAFRAQGYSPGRISTHAVETAWQSYSTTSDLVTYAFQDEGHVFWHLYFPTADASWRYDVSTGLWHEPLFNNNGVFSAHRSRCHVFVFGIHLVGDTLSGAIFQMASPKLNGQAWDFADDAGTPIRRVRTSPHVNQEDVKIRHNWLRVDVEPGLASFPAPGTGPSSLTVADDGGLPWVVSINDAGVLQFTQVPGVVQSIFITDSVLSNTSWKLGVDAADPLNPHLKVTGVPFQVAYPSRTNLVTTPGLLQTGVFILNGVLSWDAPYQGLRGPLLTLEVSNDGGKTWSSPQERDCGQIGKFLTRVIWRRLGAARDRVYRLTGSDAVPYRIIDAWLDATPGYQPQARLTDQLGKMA